MSSGAQTTTAFLAVLAAGAALCAVYLAAERKACLRHETRTHLYTAVHYEGATPRYGYDSVPGLLQLLDVGRWTFSRERKPPPAPFRHADPQAPAPPSPAARAALLRHG